MELTFLGTASGLPAPDRYGQTIVLTLPAGEIPIQSGTRLPAGGAAAPLHYVLDAGDGASSFLTRRGFDHRHIRGIFVSHMHGDHHAGFIQVVKTCMHVEKDDELIVMAPAEGIPALQAYLDASYLFEEWLGFPIRWVSLAGIGEKTIPLPGEISLRVFPNEHLSWVRQRIRSLERPPRECSFESYCAVFEGRGRRIVYSGNLNGPAGADEMAPFTVPCDLLIMELAHVDPVELGRFLGGRAIRHTAITHFHPKWNGASDQKIRELIESGAGAETIPGAITIAGDGARLSL
jgi:hypothetical protein